MCSTTSVRVSALPLDQSRTHLIFTLAPTLTLTLGLNSFLFKSLYNPSEIYATTPAPTLTLGVDRPSITVTALCRKANGKEVLKRTDNTASLCLFVDEHLGAMGIKKIRGD